MPEMKEGEEEEQDSGVDKSLLKFLTSTAYIHMEFITKLNDVWKTAIEGNKALDAKVYNLETEGWSNLLSYAKPGRKFV